MTDQRKRLIGFTLSKQEVVCVNMCQRGYSLDSNVVSYIFSHQLFIHTIFFCQWLKKKIGHRVAIRHVGRGFKRRPGGFSVWSWHVFPVSAFVLSRFSSFHKHAREADWEI